ncbi:MAG: hypothetical protein M3Z24_10430 [Chloroflexota bacterium]|nr:hypothetical protein [Chloroflexota bacterium]
MERAIVHADPRYSAVKLIEPTTLGYIHIAAEVSPRLLPLLPDGRKKLALIRRLKDLAYRLEHEDAVEKVTLFDAIAFAPPSAYVKQREEAIHVAHFDIVVLVETKSPADIHDVQMTAAYQALVDALAHEARHLHVIAARNAKRVGDVDKTRKGLFLFNYFVGDDAQVTLQVWDYMAGWYEVETGLDNSILLAPLEGQQSDYLIINHARWDGSLLRFLWRQMSKKSFRSYMLANLEANHVGAMPVLYRLA